MYDVGPTKLNLSYMPLPGEFLRARHFRESQSSPGESKLEILASNLQQHLLASRKVIEIIGIWQDTPTNTVSATGVCTPGTTMEDLQIISWKVGSFRKTLVTEDGTFYLSVSQFNRN